MTEALFPIGFETAQDRTDFIRDNANYYTITWRSNRKSLRLEYDTLEAAKVAAQIAANFLKKPVLIYGVCCPFANPEEPYGYSSWLENINPNGNHRSTADNP